MALNDYAHWNEDAGMMWWLEEGQHETYEEPEYDNEPYDDFDDDFDDDYDDRDYDESDYVGREDLGWDGGLEA